MIFGLTEIRVGKQLLQANNFCTLIGLSGNLVKGTGEIYLRVRLTGRLDGSYFDQGTFLSRPGKFSGLRGPFFPMKEKKDTRFN